MLDDIAAKRPWNLRVKWARLRALPRLRRLADGVTVIIVNWNTHEVTADVIRAVEELSPLRTRILVVDNGSTDGSRAMLRSWPGIDTMLLKSNAGHGVALDLAVCAVRTTVAVTLDSDAIPLRRGWLDPAVTPVREGKAVLAGLRATRDFVHPVYSAVDTESFVRRRLSFQAFVPQLPPGVAREWGVNAWDTAELLTGRLRPDEVVFVDPTDNLVPGLPGMTTGGVVYHHGGVSRGVGGGVEGEALAAWRDACARLRAAVNTAQEADGQDGAVHIDHPAADQGQAVPDRVGSRAAGLSVVIPVRNGAETLGEQLAALASSDAVGVDVEIVIADNGSTDDTVAVADAHRERLNLRVVDASARPGINHARNRGVAAASHDWLALCDSDDRVDRQWLPALCDAFEAGHELIAGPIDYRELNPAHVRAWRGASRSSVSPVGGFLPSGHGANLAFSRRVFDTVGGFDEEIAGGGDDVDFCWRAQLAGFSLHEATRAIVHYRLRGTIRGVARQEANYGASEALLYLKFRTHGLQRRPVAALASETWWLVSRLPFAWPEARRGAWVRKASRQFGRFRGARRQRVGWW